MEEHLLKLPLWLRKTAEVRHFARHLYLGSKGHCVHYEGEELGDLKSTLTCDMEIQSLESVLLGFGLRVIQYFLTMIPSPF